MLLKCYPINLGEEIVINRKVACYVNLISFDFPIHLSVKVFIIIPPPPAALSPKPLLERVKARGPDSGEAGFSREPDLSQTNRLS